MIKWRKFPFVRIVIAAILAIVIIEFTSIHIAGFILIGICTISPFFFNSKINQSLILLMLVFGLFGIRTTINHFEYDKGHFSKFSGNVLIGTVIDYPKTKQRTRCVVEINRRCDARNCYDTKGRLLLFFPKQDLHSTKIKPWTKIKFKSKIYELDQIENPRTFDFSRFLNYKYVYHQSFLSDTLHYDIIEKNNNSYYMMWASSFREKALDVFNQHLDRNHRKIISAMVLGYRNSIDIELNEKFVKSGAIHLLAVSGLHVGAVSGLFFLLFKRIRDKHWAVKVIKGVMLIFLLISFVLITGASPSVIRASMMYGVVFLGRLISRNSNSLNVLSFTALSMLWYDPYILFQTSFQFSFLAILGIILFFSRLKVLYKSYPIWTHRILDLVNITISAQMFIFPILIYAFHGFPIYFVLTGILAVPVAILVLYSGLALLICHFWLPLLSGLMVFICSGLTQVLLSIVEFVNKLPIHYVENIWITEVTLMLMYVVIVGVLLFLNQRFRMSFFMITIGLMGISLSSACRNHFRLNDNELVFYRLRNEVLIDIIDGGTFTTIKSSDLDLQMELAVANNYRSYKDVVLNHTIEIDCQDDWFVFNKNNPKFRSLTVMGNNIPNPLPVTDVYVITSYIPLRDLIERIDHKCEMIIIAEKYGDDPLCCENNNLDAKRINFHLQKDKAVLLAMSKKN